MTQVTNGIQFRYNTGNGRIDIAPDDIIIVPDADCILYRREGHMHRLDWQRLIEVFGYRPIPLGTVAKGKVSSGQELVYLWEEGQDLATLGNLIAEHCHILRKQDLELAKYWQDNQERFWNALKVGSYS